MKTILFLVIAMLTLIISSSVQAQPSPRTRQGQTRPHTAGIWGMETDFGSGLGIRPRSQAQTSGAANQRQHHSKGQIRPKGIGGGAAGGALVGGAVAGTKRKL